MRRYVARNILCGPMFRQCFPVATPEDVSAVKKKHILLLETVFTMWQNWETLGKHVFAVNVSGNMFPHFAWA